MLSTALREYALCQLWLPVKKTLSICFPKHFPVPRGWFKVVSMQEGDDVAALARVRASLQRLVEATRIVPPEVLTAPCPSQQTEDLNTVIIFYKKRETAGKVDFLESC